MAINSDKNKNIMAAFLNAKTVQGSGAAQKEFPIKMIDIYKIIPNENNCYAITNPEGLAFEMELNGNHVDPLEVIDNKDGTYRLVAGHRRRAAVLLRLERGDDIPSTVPCMVKEYKDDDLLSAHDREIIALIASNSQREKTTFEKLHEIVAIEPLARKIYDNELSNKKISGSFRKFFSDNFLAISSSALQRLQSLSKLIPEGRDAVEKGLLSETAAAVLASMEDEFQFQYLEMLKNGVVENTVASVKDYKEKHFSKNNTGESVTDPPVNDSYSDSKIDYSDSVEQMVNDSHEEDSKEIVNNYQDEDISHTSEEKHDDKVENAILPVSSFGVLDDASQIDAENEAMNWVLDGLKKQISSCNEHITMAQESGDSAVEAKWYFRKAKLLMVISTFE